MSKATEGQARSLIASFAVDTPWASITTDLQPFIELSPKERGARFAAFLNSNGVVYDHVPSALREIDGVIYFTVTSDGTTGENWITRLENKGFSVGEYAKEILRSADFTPTSGIVTEVAVLKGKLFEDAYRTTKKICVEAEKRRLKKPRPEIACLIREKFTDEKIGDMGLWVITTMHEPIKDSDDNLHYLGTCLTDVRGCLNTYDGNFRGGWRDSFGFAFVRSHSKAAARTV